MWQGLSQGLRAGGRHPDLAGAVERALARAARRRLRLDEALRPVLDALARIGLTRRRLERLDRR